VEECPQGSYLDQTDTTGVCRTCAAPCYTCSNSLSCLSCVGGYILNGTACQELCGEGFYLDILQVDYNSEVDNQNFSMYGQCQPCSVNCQTCLNSSNNCLSCPTGLLLVSGTCVETCPPATITQNGVCLNCPPLCLQCSSTSSCQVCVSSAVLSNVTCFTSCPQGSYRALVTNVTISSATYNCTPCSSNCLTCEGDSQYSCLSCSQGYYFINGMCLVSCPSGTFPNNATGTCSYCPATCSQCSSFTNCQACVLNYSLTNTNQCQSPVPPNCTVQSCMSCSATSATWCEQCVTGFKRWNGSCLTACPQGTYNREGNCLACSANCTYCGTEGCRYCQTGNYLYQGYCYTVCPTGTKIEGGQCVSDPCQQYSNAGGCLSCANPYLLNPASQSCVLSCPGGTVGSSGQCVNCSFNCLSCVTPSSCAACNSSTNLYKGQCYFTCPIGTFVSEGKCVECGMAYCQQCSNSSSCTVCSSSSGAFLINSTCVLYCPAGTYKSQEASECVACSTGCSLCLNSSYCSSCQSPLALYQAQCLSVCPNGAYTSNGICTPCPVGCYSCTSASNCSLCASGYLMLSSGSYYACVLSCPSGYFAAAMASTNFNNSYYYQCVTCFSPCQTCSQAGSTCTSCVSGYSLQGASCLSDCGNGYYPTIIFSTSIWGWTISIQICRHCPDICVTCSDSSTCTSCPSSYHLDQNGNCLSNCTQPNQYFDLTTRQCLNCSSTCYTCKGPLVTDCLSCYPDYYLSQGSCLSQCPYGYYASSTYRCEACSPNCANCQGSSTNCSACPTGGYLQLANGVSSCTVDCLAGYYRDTQSQTCSPCHSSCLNCTGKYPSQCISCPSNAFLSQGYCLTQCPLGSAPVVSAAGLNCLPCPSGCSVCTNTTSSSVGCTVCQSALYLSNGECLQVCPVGTYPSPESYTCRTCGIDGCYRCTYNSSLQVQCLTCQPGYYLLGNTGVCVTSCPSGYSLANSICVVDTTCRLYISNTLCLESCPQATYPLASVNANNVTIRTCTACSVGCLNCESPTSCQQCVSGALRVTISSVTSCVSICPSGYYNSTGNCLACAAPCTQCYQSSTSSTVTCAACASGYLLLNGQCLTACPSGYLPSGSTCLPCASQCAECSTSSSNCTVCKSASYPVPACVSQNCTGSQYQDISGNCLSCYAACSACFGGSSYECTSCSSGYFLLNGQCLSACPEGYVASGSACTLCPSHCLNCTASACSVCLTGYLMAAGQCVASCEQLNTNQVTYYTTASSCVLCNSTVSQCLVCSTSASPISCSQCQGGSYLYLGTCVTSCPGGFYLNTAASTCAACLANCTVCVSATTCTACVAGTVLSNGLCISSCSTGTYLSTISGVSSCLPCSSHCLTCTASGCTSCVQPYTLISAQCTGCVSGYYFSSLVGICIKCSG
jgi:proprotein convertase subtilisin/kexin type 5